MEEDTDSDINVFSAVSDTDSQDISENNISEKCLNTSLYLMPYDADDYDDIIFIKMLDSKNHFATGNCITRNEFKQSLSIDITNHISVDSPPVNLMCIYTSPPNGNVTGQGCRATNNIFVKLPLNNMFIALESAKRLFREKETHTFYAIPLFGGKRKRIGNLTELHGISTNHGQVPGFVLHKLCTKEELQDPPKIEFSTDLIHFDSSDQLRIIVRQTIDEIFEALDLDDTSLMDLAAENGDFDEVQRLHQLGYNCTTKAIDLAAAEGHLEIVKYLHETVGAKYTHNAIDLAAAYGYLEVVKYLHRIGAKYTIFAMKEAARNGHLNVVKYLDSIGAEYTTNAMNWAAKYGHLDVVEYLRHYSDSD